MTDEEPALVDKFVRKFKPTYPIVILKSGDFEGFLGVGGFPHGAVIAPDGTLSYTGSAYAMAGEVGKAMSKARKGSIWPKALDKAAKLMEKQDYDKGYAEVLKLIEGGKLSDGDQGTAAMFQSYLEGLAASGLARGRAHLEEGFVYRGVQAVEYWAGTKSTLPATEDCKKLLEELQAVPEVKKELSGGELYEEAVLFADDGAYTEAIDAYKQVLKKAPDTKIAEHARTAAQALIEEGMAGYEVACDACQKARRACAKHKEEVEI